MQRTFLHFALCMLTSLAVASGCAKARAQTVPDGPPLATPPPPSRAFAPIEEEEPLASAQVPNVDNTASGSTLPKANNTTKPQTPRPRPAEAERTEQPAVAAPQPVPTVEAPRELRAASSPSDAESERKVADLMRRATQALNGVYYQGLSPVRKEQYELVKANLKGADEAVKERNFPYAETLADKALKLASELLTTQR
jgi:hypothetical protein